MSANPATAPDLVSAVHAPDIPGLAFRHGRARRLGTP